MNSRSLAPYTAYISACILTAVTLAAGFDQTFTRANLLSPEERKSAPALLWKILPENGRAQRVWPQSPPRGLLGNLVYRL